MKRFLYCLLIALLIPMLATAQSVPANPMATHGKSIYITPTPSPEPTPEPDPDPAPVTFIDVPEGAWYHDWVTRAAEAGIMTGYRDESGAYTGYFGPEDSLTRGQAATVLWRIAGCPDAADGGRLPDVLPGLYYSRAVAWCVEKGIVTGYLDGPYAGLFRPDAPVSREELAVMAYRFAAWAGANTSSAPADNLERCIDVAQVSGWSRDALTWCAAAGVIAGKETAEGLLLAPQEGATRAQAAKVLVRVYAIAVGGEQPYAVVEPMQAEAAGSSDDVQAQSVGQDGDEVTFDEVAQVPVASESSPDALEAPVDAPDAGDAPATAEDSDLPAQDADSVSGTAASDASLDEGATFDLVA